MPKYKVTGSKHRHQGKACKVGDVIEVSEDHAKAFPDVLKLEVASTPVAKPVAPVVVQKPAALAQKPSAPVAKPVAPATKVVPQAVKPAAPEQAKTDTVVENDETKVA